MYCFKIFRPLAKHIGVCLQLHVQDLNVKVAMYNPWALRVINCCKGFLLLDTRERDGQSAESSEVIAIQKQCLTQVRTVPHSGVLSSMAVLFEPFA